MPTKSTPRKFVVAAIFTMAALVSQGALADYSEVNRLIRSGQLAEAVAKADQFLAGKPKDPQMRFLKGVVLTEQGKPQDAITVFTKLIEDFPELPEPYNNLAVLHAGQGQFDRARAALEMAIRTNPSYATAHENLGDVYAKLASQAYAKALQLDASNAGVQPKLSLIRDLFTPGKSARPAVAAAPNAPRPTASAPAGAVAAAPTAPAAAVTSAPVAPAARAAADAEVRSAVQAWAGAWSRRDMQAYLAAYGKDFEAPGGRKFWEEERRARIVSKKKISVKVSGLNVTVDGDRAEARFRQAYEADGLSVNSRKQLDMVKLGGQWLIVKESTGG